MLETPSERRRRKLEKEKNDRELARLLKDFLTMGQRRPGAVVTETREEEESRQLPPDFAESYETRRDELVDNQRQIIQELIHTPRNPKYTPKLQLEIFTGEKNTITWNTWLKKYRLLTMDWSDERRMSNMVKYVSQDALTYLFTMVDDVTTCSFTRACELLGTRFDSETDSFKARIQFNHKTQQKGQSYDDYAKDLEAMLHKAFPNLPEDIRDHMLCSRFKQGVLDPVLKQKLMDLLVDGKHQLPTYLRWCAQYEANKGEQILRGERRPTISSIEFSESASQPSQESFDSTRPHHGTIRRDERSQYDQSILEKIERVQQAMEQQDQKFDSNLRLVQGSVDRVRKDIAKDPGVPPNPGSSNRGRSWGDNYPRDNRGPGSGPYWCEFHKRWGGHSSSVCQNRPGGEFRSGEYRGNEFRGRGRQRSRPRNRGRNPQNRSQNSRSAGPEMERPVEESRPPSDETDRKQYTSGATPLNC